MQAGEVGVLLTVNAGKDLSAAGTTPVLRVRQSGVSDRVLPLTVDPVTTTSCTRRTLATDFPSPGIFRVRLEVTFTNGDLLKSAFQSLNVEE